MIPEIIAVFGVIVGTIYAFARAEQHITDSSKHHSIEQLNDIYLPRGEANATFNGLNEKLDLIVELIKKNGAHK